MRLSFVGKIKAKNDFSILLVRGLVNEQPMFYYIGVRQDKAIEFLNAEKRGGHFDLGDAVLLKKGEGLDPPEELQQEIYEAYGIKPMTEAEVREQMGDLLAPEDDE